MNSQLILLINLAINLSSPVLVMSLYSEEKNENKPRTKKFMARIWHAYLAVVVPISLLISIFSLSL